MLRIHRFLAAKIWHPCIHGSVGGWKWSMWWWCKRPLQALSSLTFTIYLSGEPGALLGASLPQIQFYAETHASGGYAIITLRKTKILNIIIFQAQKNAHILAPTTVSYQTQCVNCNFHTQRSNECNEAQQTGKKHSINQDDIVIANCGCGWRQHFEIAWGFGRDWSHDIMGFASQSQLKKKAFKFCTSLYTTFMYKSQ